MSWGNSGVVRKLALTSLLVLLVGLLASCSWFKSGPKPATPQPPSAAEHWESAMTYKKAGNFAMAAVELERAIRIDPNMYQAYYNLGMVYADMGQNMQAMRVWRAGLEKARTGPDRLDYPRAKAISEIQTARAALQDKMIAQTKPKPLPTPKIEPAPVAPKPLTPVPAPAPPAAAPKQPKGKYGVLYASYKRKATAAKVVNKLKARDLPASVRQAKVKGKRYYRAVVGCCTTRTNAKKILRRMQKMGYKENMIIMKLR